MRLHFLPIPVHSSTAAEAELNHFLATHRVLGIDRQSTRRRERLGCTSPTSTELSRSPPIDA